MKNRFRKFIEDHPKAAPWIDALAGSTLYGLVAGWLLGGPLRSRLVEALAVGVGGYVTTVIARRRIASRNQHPGV